MPGDAFLDQPVQPASGARVGTRTAGVRSPAPAGPGTGTVRARRRTFDLLLEFAAQRGGVLVGGPHRGQALLRLLQALLRLLYDLLRRAGPALLGQLVAQLGGFLLVGADLL